MGRDTLSLFVLALLFGCLACILGYRVMWYLSRAGVPVKIFGSVFDTVRMFRQYKQLAPSRGWSRWPIVGFWVFAAIAFVFGIAAGLSLGSEQRSEGFIRIASKLLLTRAIFIWIYFAIVLQALWFTYRLLRKVPLTAEGRRDWKHLVREEYLRSDFYLAVLGWIGLVLLYFVYRIFVKA